MTSSRFMTRLQLLTVRSYVLFPCSGVVNSHFLFVHPKRPKVVRTVV